MPERCVAARCGNVKDPDRNISIHKIPFFGDVCRIKKKRWKKWVDFVLERRKMWVPGKTSSLCSVHFAPDDFERPLNKEVNLKRDLKKDEIGVCVFPSIHAKRKGDDEPPCKKRREAQMVRKYCYTCSRHFMWFFFLWFIIGPHTIKVKENTIVLLFFTDC